MKKKGCQITYYDLIWVIKTYGILKDTILFVFSLFISLIWFKNKIEALYFSTSKLLEKLNDDPRSQEI